MRVELVAGDLPLHAPGLSIGVEDARPNRGSHAEVMRTRAPWLVVEACV
jgi:hypothetical protein